MNSPTRPQRPRRLAQGLVDVRRVAAARLDAGDDVERGHVDVQEVVPTSDHGQPEVDRGEPAGPEPHAQRRSRA